MKMGARALMAGVAPAASCMAEEPFDGLAADRALLCRLSDART